jgi:D-glucosaminate-6-phosphate ammonia-lyase
VVPRNSRTVYDHAIRMLSVKMVEVETREQYLAALSDKTAMVYLMGGPADEFLPPVADATRQKGIPIFVDAAAEELTIPNVHLQRGATMVAYSGGKCLRGPQCAGLLLGPRDLLWAAWLNSAPHHAFGRSLKVGKEEIVGMLAAAEMWVKRDHQAEWKTWESWLAHIAESVTRIPTVKTQVLQPRGLSNRAPRLRISWDSSRVGVTGEMVAKLADEGTPRIVFGGATGSGRRGGDEESSVSIMPYMMMPGDEQAVATRLYEILSNPPAAPRPQQTGTPVLVAGQWDVKLEFVRGVANHRLFLEQEGETVTGTHRGDLLAGDLRGTVEGDRLLLRSSFRYEGTRIGWQFDGRLANNQITGTVHLGEYGQAKFTAERHQYAGMANPAGRDKGSAA